MHAISAHLWWCEEYNYGREGNPSVLNWSEDVEDTSSVHCCAHAFHFRYSLSRTKPVHFCRSVCTWMPRKSIRIVILQSKTTMTDKPYQTPFLCASSTKVFQPFFLIKRYYYIFIFITFCVFFLLDSWGERRERAEKSFR